MGKHVGTLALKVEQNPENFSNKTKSFLILQPHTKIGDSVWNLKFYQENDFTITRKKQKWSQEWVQKLQHTPRILLQQALPLNIIQNNLQSNQNDLRCQYLATDGLQFINTTVTLCSVENHRMNHFLVPGRRRKVIKTSCSCWVSRINCTISTEWMRSQFIYINIWTWPCWIYIPWVCIPQIYAHPQMTWRTTSWS